MQASPRQLQVPSVSEDVQSKSGRQLDYRVGKSEFE